MKLLIASDIHGDIKCTEALISISEKLSPDKIVLLGDILYHGPRNNLPYDYNPKAVISLLNAHKTELLCVRGNCDTEVDQMVLEFPILADYAQVLDGERKITLFLTHGHIYNPDRLPPIAGKTALLYGHTHIQKIEVIDGTLCVNPGSVTLPKAGNPRTYAVYDNGEISIWDFDGNIINSVKI